MQNWDKVRHEIKPEVFYSYIPGIRQENLPDYLPKLSSMIENFTSFSTPNANFLMEQNAVAWALTNTLTARVKNKAGAGASSYLELLRFKLFQVYDINEAKKDTTGSTVERQPFSDLGIELDLRPHPYLSFAVRNKYNPYAGWKEMNYDLGLNDWRGDSLTFGYRYTIDYIEEINAALKVVITERLSGNLVLRRDQFNDRTVESTVGLTYKQQCWGVGVDYSKTYDVQRIMFKLSLAGLGLFGMQ
jgi:LPS-assembly protein